MRRRELHYLRTDGNRRVRRRRRRLSAARLIGLTVLFAVLGTGLLYGGRALARQALADPACRVRAIEVTGGPLIDTEAVRNRLFRFIGEPLLLLDLDEVRHGALEDPWVADALVSRVWPCTLRVVVQERAPAALAMLDSRPWLAAADGTLLAPLGPESPVTDLPVLTGLPPGSKARLAAVRRGASVLAALNREAPSLAGRVSTVDLSERDRTTVQLSGQGFPLWLDAETPDRNLSSYAAFRPVMNDLMAPAGIDLRWQGRIVAIPRQVEN